MALTSPSETTPTRRVYVAPVSFGLGDLVVSLPAVQALIEEGQGSDRETWLVTRSSSQAGLAERIPGLAGCIAEDAFHRACPAGRLVDLRDHPLQRDYWWGSAEFERAFGPMVINDILARICADFAIDADFTRPVPLTAHPRPELRSTVLLVLDTDGPTKRWSAERWGAVATGIRGIGLDVRAVTRTNGALELGGGRIDAVAAATPGEAVDVLSSAAAVVGVDTGLTHVAAQQGTPTVMICRADPVYFRSWPHTRAVIGGRCDDACTAAEDEYAYNERVDLRGFEWQPRRCPVDGRCLAAVQPEDVLRAVGQLR
jgi:hypothetical protein